MIFTVFILSAFVGIVAGVCRIQGELGADMDMQPDGNGLIANGQLVKVQAFRINRGNA